MAPLRHIRLQQHVVGPRARSRGQHRPRGRHAGGIRPTRAGQDAAGVLEQHVVLLCAVGGGGHHAARRRRLLAAHGVLGLVLRLRAARVAHVSHHRREAAGGTVVPAARAAGSPLAIITAPTEGWRAS